MTMSDPDRTPRLPTSPNNRHSYTLGTAASPANLFCTPPSAHLHSPFRLDVKSSSPLRYMIVEEKLIAKIPEFNMVYCIRYPLPWPLGIRRLTNTSLIESVTI